MGEGVRATGTDAGVTGAERPLSDDPLPYAGTDAAAAGHQGHGQQGTASQTAVRVQRRVVRVLAVGQLFNGLGIAVGVAMAPLAAASVSGSATIGGIASASLVAGTAVSALPMARVASRHGRRPALSLGFGCGAVGSAIAALSLAGHAWLPMIAGMVLFGFSSSASYATRYAATDLARPDRRGSDLAIVVWPTTVGVVIGPNVLAPAQHLAAAWQLAPLAGPFIVTGLAFTITAGLVIAGLRPDPLLLARSLADPGPAAAPRPPRGRSGGWLPLTSLRALPRVRGCIYAIALGHAVMIGIMVMAPVSMQQRMVPLATIGMVVSGHLFGMYALSPVMGWLTDRLGAPVVILAGLVLAAIAALIMFGAGMHPWLSGLGLFLLGVGWSADVVAGSAMLTQHTPAAERPVMQGLSDLVMDVCGVIASLLAGVIVADASFGTLSLAAVALIAALLPWQMRILARNGGQAA